MSTMSCLLFVHRATWKEPGEGTAAPQPLCAYLVRLEATSLSHPHHHPPEAGSAPGGGKDVSHNDISQKTLMCQVLSKIVVLVMHYFT